MIKHTEITQEEFKRLQLFFDVKGIMYTAQILYTKEYPTWAIMDEDMQTILCSTKKDGEVVFYLPKQGVKYLEQLKESYTYKDGTEIKFS